MSILDDMTPASTWRLGGPQEEKYYSATEIRRAEEALAVRVQSASFPERDSNKPAEQQGLFRKFIVARVDGSDRRGGKHEGCEYFVIDMEHDAHASAALAAYATSCANTHPQLSADLLARFGNAAPQPPVAEPSVNDDLIATIRAIKKDAGIPYRVYGLARDAIRRYEAAKKGT